MYLLQTKQKIPYGVPFIFWILVIPTIVLLPTESSHHRSNTDLPLIITGEKRTALAKLFMGSIHVYLGPLKMGRNQLHRADNQNRDRGSRKLRQHLGRLNSWSVKPRSFILLMEVASSFQSAVRRTTGCFKTLTFWCKVKQNYASENLAFILQTVLFSTSNLRILSEVSYIVPTQASFS